MKSLAIRLTHVKGRPECRQCDTFLIQRLRRRLGSGCVPSFPISSRHFIPFSCIISYGQRFLCSPSRRLYKMKKKNNNKRNRKEQTMKYKTNEDKSCRKHLNERVFVFFLFLTGSFWDAGVGQLGNGTLDVIDLDRRSKKLSRRVAVVSFRQTENNRPRNSVPIVDFGGRKTGRRRSCRTSPRLGHYSYFRQQLVG